MIFYFLTMITVEKRVLVPSDKILYWCNIPATLGDHSSSNISETLKNNYIIRQKLVKKKTLMYFK